MRRSSQRAGGWIVGLLAVVLAGPALAQAQSTKPGVSTGAVADRTSQSATLLGRVDPNGAQTTYFFQYGTTRLYGAATPPGVMRGSVGAMNVTAQVGALAPFTTYHYRLVARNRNGTVLGADRTFKTLRQPLGLALAATPNPVPFGRPAVLAGTLTGTGNANRRVMLQSNPFPYTQGFQPTANVQLTNALGQFAFPLLSVPLNTQYRVVIPDRPQVASPIVSVGVAVRVGTNTSRTRVRTGRVVRFFGTVRPARPGAQFAVQRLRRGSWVTLTGGITHGSARGVSRYAKRVRIRRGGRYRVFVAIVDGNYVSSAGRTVRITRVF
ncbi:MAG TPA: hypothetical protein VG474_17635 [Solirubrobacteraceae bacterium]|nr:hypothetical protein [Solirubrobacteraceae bacterium]